MIGFGINTTGHDHAAFGRVAGAGDLHLTGWGDHTFHGHLVTGQGTGLVRADHGGGAQGFDGMQLLDDGVVGGHALHTKGQYHGKDGGQAFRYGGHSQRNGEKQRINHVMDVVEALEHGERYQYHDGDDAHRNTQNLGDIIHLLL